MKKILVLFSVMFAMWAISVSGIVITAIPVSAEPMSTESCEAACRKCQKVCEETLAYCKKKGGKHASHYNALKDCIMACKTSVDFLSRSSARHMKSCAFCAVICTDCAESCDTLPDDQKMKECAAECRKCAESCKKMSELMK